MSDPKITIHFEALAAGYKAFEKATNLDKKPRDYPFLMGVIAYLQTVQTALSPSPEAGANTEKSDEAFPTK